MTQAVSSYPQFAFHLVTNALNAFTIYDFFDDGIADILGLQTYTHGTAPKCNYGILWAGADPRLGGHEKLGETGMRGPREGDWDCRRKFFVGTDVAFRAGEHDSDFDCCCLDFATKIQPRVYSIIATGSVCNADCCLAAVPCGLPLSIFSPTIKFRFLPEEARAQDFQKDPTVKMRLAAFTMKPITPDHIGLYGTLSHGLQGNIHERIEQDSARLLRGLVKIAIAVALVAIVLTGSSELIAFWLMYEAILCVGRIAVPLIFGTISTIEVPA